MHKFLSLGLSLIFVVLISACDQLDQFSDIQDSLTGGEDINDDIEHVVTVEEEEATLSTYTTSLSMEDAQETLRGFMKDEGYEKVYEEKELGYFVQFGDAGYNGVLFKDDDNYVYVHYADSSDELSIVTVTAPKEAYASHYEEGDTSNNGDERTLPESDEPGEDIETFPRYEGFVRMHYAQMEDSDTSQTLIEYLGEANHDEVISFYLEALDATSLSLETMGTQGAEYYIEASNDTFEVKIVIRDLEDGFVEVILHYLEHL